MNIAVIPARGGSKRVPRKNIRLFAGKPMIVHSIHCAVESRLFERVVVSTDDPEIAEIALLHGATVPFLRPSDLSDDYATTDSVMLHALVECRNSFGVIEAACCIYPTAPFLRSTDLGAGLDLLRRHDATSAFSVVDYDFPIEQAFVLNGARVQAVWPDKLMARSQDLRSFYHDAALFYWLHVERFLLEGRIFAEDSVAIMVPRECCQDINTETDWRQAEIKYRLLRGGQS